MFGNIYLLGEFKCIYEEHAFHIYLTIHLILNKSNLATKFLLY